MAGTDVTISYASTQATDAKLEIKFTIDGDNANVEKLKATAGYKLFVLGDVNNNSGYIRIGTNTYVTKPTDAVTAQKVIEDLGSKFALIKVDEDSPSIIKVDDVKDGNIVLLNGTNAKSGTLKEVKCAIEELPVATE